MWNFILIFTDLYLHPHECWTMEVLLNFQCPIVYSTSTMVQNNVDLAATTVLFPCYSHKATPIQVPCRYVYDPIDYVTSLPVRLLCWEWLVSPPSMSNQPWGLESSRMWYPTHDGKLSWQASMTLSDVPPHFIGLGPSAFNTFSKGLTNLSLPEYPVKGKFHGLIQPAKAWLPRSTHPCVFAPLLQDQCTWPSFLVWGSVRGAAVNVSSPTRLPTGHSSNIKFDEPTHSPLHVPRKAVYPGVHSATFSQGIGPSRNKCQQHAYSRPHPHGQDVSERLSGTPTNSPLPTFWPCGCVQLYTCGWHLFLVGRTT